MERRRSVTDDKELIGLYLQRNERAIAESKQKYGTMCMRLAERILGNSEDAEECVNDVLMQAWNTVPDQPPEHLPAYLTALTRNIAVNRLKQNRRLKRGGGQIPAVLDELAECIPADETVESAYDRHCFLTALERFLATLSHDARVIFLRRYWYLESSREIAGQFGMSESKVRVTLMRTRRKLKSFLEKEEIL